MRNNQDRFGAPGSPEQGDSPIPFTQENSSTFSYAVPTEMVELPSKGRFYPSDHPLHNVIEVQIRHMTAKDEDILTSQSLIKRGIVLDKLLESVLFDKRIKTEDLLVGDKNALILACRRYGYGQFYEAKINCPSCSEDIDCEFDIEKWKFKKDPNLEELVVTQTENGTFLITLPVSAVQVEFKLLSGADENKINAIEERNKKMNLPSANSTNTIKAIVVSVDGSYDASNIFFFAENIPASDARYLRNTYNKVCPDIDVTSEFSCQNCGFTGAVEVPLNIDFFWPEQ